MTPCNQCYLMYYSTLVPAAPCDRLTPCTMALAGHCCPLACCTQELRLCSYGEVRKARSTACSLSRRRRGSEIDRSVVVVAQPQQNEACRSTGKENGMRCRRNILLGSVMLAAVSPFSALAATAEDAVPLDIDLLASYAFQAYNEKDLKRAQDYFSKIVARDPNPVWLERRGQVLVDMKLFAEALDDFNRAEALYRYAMHSTDTQIFQIYLHIDFNSACLLSRQQMLRCPQTVLKCRSCNWETAWGLLLMQGIRCNIHLVGTAH